MATCDYQLVGVAIRKDLHVQAYRYPRDPYDLALTFALERLLFILQQTGQRDVMIIAEKRGQREDRELFVSFQRIVTTGTYYVDAARFRQVTFTLRFLPKSMNIVGTQIADLAAYPVARHVLDPSKLNPAFDVIRPKLYRNTVKVFP